LLEQLAASRLLDRLAGVHPSGRDLEPPVAADESVVVHEEKTTVVENRDDAHGVMRVLARVMLDHAAVRQLHVVEPEVDPGALVDRPVTADLPERFGQSLLSRRRPDYRRSAARGA